MIGNRRVARVANRGQRGDVDDGALALAFHDRKDVFAAQEHALDVDCEQVVPLLLGSFFRPAHLQDPHVVVEDIDPSVDLQATIHHGPDLFRPGNVRPVDGALSSLLRNDAASLLGCIGIDIHGQHLGALPGKEDGDSLAVAPTGPDRAGSGDDGYPVLETVSHGIPPADDWIKSPLPPGHPDSWNSTKA